MIAQNLGELIGKTPILKLSTISKICGANIFAKCEFMNPNGSIKDRISLSMIKDGLEKGSITKNTTVIEATSGNTGVGLAGICSSLGIKLITVMPSSMSVERQKLMRALGATLELTPPEKGMNGAIEKSKELNAQIQDSIIIGQFNNLANPEIHRKTTAQEILQDFEGMNIDVFIAGVGTGGCITGVGEILKEKYKNIHIIAVEPESSRILSGGTHSPHKIQGIGSGFIPDVLNTSIYEETIGVSNDDAFEAAKLVGKKEGVLVGISSGANVYASMKLSEKFKNKNILTILCDTGERYLSTELFL